MGNKSKYYIDVLNGGMVTNVSNDNLGPNPQNGLVEFPLIDNFDFTNRGALQKRNGYSNIYIRTQGMLDLGYTSEQLTVLGFDDTRYAGKSKGYFKFEPKGFYEQADGSLLPPDFDDPFYDIRLSVVGENLILTNLNEELLDTTGLETIFPTKIIQTGLTGTEIMEAVQFGNELFLATGTAVYIIRLVRNFADDSQHEITSARLDSTDEIYYPDGNEYQAVGANVFFPEGVPDIEDEVSSPDPLEILGIRVNPSRGVINKPSSAKAFVKTPTADPSLLFWNVIIKDPDGTEIVNFKNVTPYFPIYEFLPTKVGTYSVYFGASIADDSVYETELTILYEVQARDDGLHEVSFNDEINACTRIMLYYNRIILYGNGTGRWYKSDINRPAYYTVFGIFDFSSVNPENHNEILQAALPYRNGITVLTEDSTYQVLGKGDDFADIAGNFSPFVAQRVLSRGTIAKFSVATTENVLVFLASDGIYAITTISVDENRANAYKISDLIGKLTIQDCDASGVVFENKYYLNFPSANYTLKWDYIYGSRMSGGNFAPERLWTRDISDVMIFGRMYVIDNRLYAIDASDSNYNLFYNNHVDDIVSDGEIYDLENLNYPTGFFLDVTSTIVSWIETKGYNFKDSSMLKKVKTIIVEMSKGSFTMLYFANANAVIDAVQVPKIIFDDILGRITDFDGTLETNLLIEGGFILNTTDGVLGINLLGDPQDAFVYFNLRKAKWAQNHKLVFQHSQDEYAKILAFGFQFITGKNPRDKFNQK